MKYFNLPLLLITFLVIIFANCAETSSGSRRPVTSIELQPKKENYQIGEKIVASFQTKLKNGNLENIEIFLDGKSIFKSQKIENLVEINTTDFRVGIHSLKVIASKSDSTKGENYINFKVISDINPKKYSYKIVATYPHNPQSFTQGLEFNNGTMYEGTGQEGSSALYKIDFKTGKALKEHKLDNQIFGEGITIFNDKIYQISYKNKTGFVYDLKSFDQIKTWIFRQNEGWGLTHDQNSIIMSDGTESIYYLNPETLEEERTIQVSNNIDVIKNINELEYINGQIWANIWQTEFMIIIDPKNGKVVGEIDFSGITNLVASKTNHPVDVLNGIAYNNLNNKIYITGKLWNKLFEIELIEK